MSCGLALLALCSGAGAIAPGSGWLLALRALESQHPEAVKKAVPEMAVRAVGMIADPDQAEEIVASGKADMVALARAFLDNPRWVWHAAERFGLTVPVPPQYERAAFSAWQGSKLARPRNADKAA